jgi:hypothetical protein
MGDPKALRPAENPFAIKVDPCAFAAMVENLSVAWTAPEVTMRVRQHLLEDVGCRYRRRCRRKGAGRCAHDPLAGQLAGRLPEQLAGRQHPELRVRKPRPAEQGCATANDAPAVMCCMAGRWSAWQIAAALNRMGLPTGQAET